MVPKSIAVNSNGVKLIGDLYLSNPKAPTLLLLHGLGSYAIEYTRLAPLLVRKGFNCFTPDFRSHGRSGGKRGDWKLDDLIKDTIHVIHYLDTHFSNPIGVFGNSLGAVVAIYTTAKCKTVRSLVASNTTTTPSETLVNPLRKLILHASKLAYSIFPFRIDLSHFIPLTMIIDDPTLRKIIEEDPLIQSARKFTPPTYEEMVKWDASKPAKKIHVPFLVLQGKEDRLQPISQAELLYQSANDPKELNILPAGHLPNFENPELIAEVAGNWYKHTL